MVGQGLASAAESAAVPPGASPRPTFGAPIICNYNLLRMVLQQKILPESVFSNTSLVWKMYRLPKIVKKKKTFSEFLNFMVVNSAIIR